MYGQMMDSQLTLDKILEHANRIYGHKKIYTKLPDGSFHDYTYRDLYKRVKRLAKALVGLGIAEGDRVGTFAWNNYQHLELYYAIPGAGAVCHSDRAARCDGARQLCLACGSDSRRCQSGHHGAARAGHSCFWLGLPLVDCRRFGVCGGSVCTGSLAVPPQRPVVGRVGGEI